MGSCDSFKILLLGEGDFSFSFALCRSIRKLDILDIWEFLSERLGISIPSSELKKLEVFSTSFDSHEELVEKYAEFLRISKYLKSCDSERVKFFVLHGVNACELENVKEFQGFCFDIIIWNHPHLGIEDFNQHKFLFKHVFYSTKKFLKPNGAINISLVESQKQRWDLERAGKEQDLHLVKLVNITESQWEGYVCRRNKTGDSFKNSRTRSHFNNSPMQSTMYQFSMNEQKVKDARNSVVDNVTHNITDNNITDKITTEPLNEKCIQNERKKRVLSMIPKDLVCGYCKKQLSCTRAYMQHVHMVHVLKQFGEDYVPGCEKKISCTYSFCTRKFRKESDLQTHLVSKHSLPSKEIKEDVQKFGEYFACLICGQAVLNAPEGIEIHMKSFRPAMSLNLRCEFCSKRFTESRALLQHSRFCRIVPMVDPVGS